MAAAEKRWAFWKQTSIQTCREDVALVLKEQGKDAAAATEPAGSCLDNPASAADDGHASGWIGGQTPFT